MKLTNKPILNYAPHYTNDRFKKAQTVWGHESEDLLFYNYSDRLYQWDYGAYKEALNIASEKAENTSSLWVQEFLSAYHKKPVKLYHIMAGYNVSNGFPYQVFGYKFIKGLDNGQ